MSALIVHHHPDIADELKQIIDRTWSMQTDVVASKTKAEEKLAARPHSLLIVERDIAETPALSRDPEGRVGLRLAEAATRTAASNLTVVVIALHLDDDLNRWRNSFDNCYVVTHVSQEDLLKDFEVLLMRLVKIQAGQPLTRLSAVVDICIQGGRKHCTLHGTDRKGHAIYVDEDIALPDKIVKRLIQKTNMLYEFRRLFDYDTWEAELKDCGKILDTIFHNNTDVLEAYTALLDYELNDVHYNFFVDRYHYPIVYEALVRREEFCSLQSGFARRLRMDDVVAYPLLWEHERESAEAIKCLVIASNVNGVQLDPSGKKFKLAGLDYLPQECADLAALDYNTKTGAAQTKRRLAFTLLTMDPRPKDFPADFPEQQYRQINPAQFKDTVLEHLRRGPWDIVHYLGHSESQRLDGKAVLFFPTASGVGVEPIPVTRFSEWLRKARLVYLSSCESASEGVAFALAGHGVSAIIGFRWPIPDGVALEFSRAFYAQMFIEGKRMGPAFAAARLTVKQRHYDKPDWIAPVLVVQHPPEDRRSSVPIPTARSAITVSLVAPTNSEPLAPMSPKREEGEIASASLAPASSEE